MRLGCGWKGHDQRGVVEVAVTIDLRPASLTGKSAGGYVSGATGIGGGITIASGVAIENAIGGAKDDVLTGNASANVLNGRAAPIG